MKVRIEATAEELKTKGPRLLETLAKAFSPHDDAIAAALIKAVPKKEPALKHQVLRDSHKVMAKRYSTTLSMMIDEIGDFLESRIDLEKSEGSPDYIAGVVDLETKAYEKVKEQLAPHGFVAADFEEGGSLYGDSVNRLREILAELKKQEAG